MQSPTFLLASADDFILSSVEEYSQNFQRQPPDLPKYRRLHLKRPFLPKPKDIFAENTATVIEKKIATMAY